jgi:7-cyano-7-deazaguanine synthase
MRSSAMVVLSGGQDSATCAAWAATRFDELHAVTFNYNQRHKREIEAAKGICGVLGIKSHRIVDVPALMGNPTSGLTDPSVDPTEMDDKTGLPKSFVPGRNLVFLTQAASIALSMGIFDLVTGVCQTDYSGYPDCRDGTISTLEDAIHLGNVNLIPAPMRFKIHRPLMYLTKAQTVKMAEQLPKGTLCVARSWTCYLGGDQPCGHCPACELRAKGFMEAGVADPALY